MIIDYETLKLIWLLLIAALFMGFAISGGFDLGVAALLPILGKNDNERRLLLNSIGPTWEGNQVWLITAAGALFAAWPLLYAAVFSSFYFVFLLVLLSLILRPPGLDYRSKLSHSVWRSLWDGSLFISGFLPSFLFGVAIGNLLLGVPFFYDEFLTPHASGTLLGTLTPYTILLGLTSLSLLLLHGALFIQLKTTETLHLRAAKVARWLGILFIFSFSLACFWTAYKIEGFKITSIPDLNKSFTPLDKEVIKGMDLWQENYIRYPLGLLAPASCLITPIIALIFSAFSRPGKALFFTSLSMIGIILTLGFTLFPFIMPSSSTPNHSLTIWDAASSQLTLTWMLGAVAFFLPIVLCYTTWAYRIMRGKVTVLETLKNSGAY